MILSTQLDGERGQVNSKRAKNLRTIRTLIPITSLVLPFALAFAQAPAARPEFEVASVGRNHSGSRPWLVPPVGGRFRATNVTLRLLIGVGWPQKVSGSPSWVATNEQLSRPKAPSMPRGNTRGPRAAQAPKAP